MEALWERLRALFLVPAAARPAAAAPAPPSVGLLCRPGDALGTGAALALSLARAARLGPPVLCLWRAEPARPAWTAPVAPEARRGVAATSAHGLDVEGGGRLVRVTLPQDSRDAAVAAHRAAVVAAGPVVHAIAGARDEAVDGLLAVQDGLVLVAHGGDDPVAELAQASLAALGPPVCSCHPVRGPARTLAAAGIRTAAMRAQLGLALEPAR
jgi:hypothetical protein